MKRWTSVFFVAALGGCVNTAQQMRETAKQLHQEPSQTLCVDYAESVITGANVSLNGSAYTSVSGAQLAQEIKSRGIRCQPWMAYLQTAAQRIRLNQERKQANDAMMMRAGMQLLQQSQPRAYGAPATTTASGFTATAIWTGRSKNVNTITSQSGVSCQYNYEGQYFWRTFVGFSCPASINVQ